MFLFYFLVWYILTGSLSLFYVFTRVYILPQLFKPKEVLMMNGFFLVELQTIESVSKRIDKRIEMAQDIEQVLSLSFLKNKVTEVQEFFKWCIEQPTIAQSDIVLNRCQNLKNEILEGWSQLQK